MSDIVERLREDADNHFDVAKQWDQAPDKTINWAHALNANEAADEIESLRQRVKELEGYKAAWIETAKHRDRAERELAEFKRSQQVAPEQGQSNRYCPVGGNCSDASDCDGSCAPYIGRGQQGEPVAWASVKISDGSIWEFHRKDPTADIAWWETQNKHAIGWLKSVPLYTATTIPEGYVMVQSGPLDWMQSIEAASTEPLFHELRAVMGTENYGQDIALLQTLRRFRRKLLQDAAAPKPEDVK